MAKKTVEGHKNISIRDWERRGVLTKGIRNWCWVDGQFYSGITVEAQLSRVILRYKVQEWSGGKLESIEDPIALGLSDGGLGRERLWFLCSGCGERAANLYLDKYFRCRRCHGLVYRSQKVSPPHRALSRIQRDRMKLGGTPYLGDPFPPKPRYMHWKKYFRMMKEDEKRVRQHLLQLGVSFAIGDLLDQRSA